MTTPFTQIRLDEIRAEAKNVRFTTAMNLDTHKILALRVLQWVQIDFEKNPSAENFERLVTAMETYQHYMKNVRTQKQVS